MKRKPKVNPAWKVADEGFRGAASSRVGAKKDVVGRAMDAVDDVFSDTSVAKEERIDRLREIKEEIEMKIESLENT